MPRDQRNQNTQQKQCCDKFNKDFKNGPHQKKKKKKKTRRIQCPAKTLNSREWFVNGVNGGATIITERAMIQGSQVKIPGGETVYTSDPLIPSLLPSQDPWVELAGLRVRPLWIPLSSWELNKACLLYYLYFIQEEIN